MIIIITYCTFHHYTCWPYQPLHTCICQILLILVHCDCVRIEETFVISFFFSRFIRFCFCVHYSHFRVVFGRLCACDKLSFNVVPIVSANRMHDVFNISFRLLFSINSIFFFFFVFSCVVCFIIIISRSACRRCRYITYLSTRHITCRFFVDISRGERIVIERKRQKVFERRIEIKYLNFVETCSEWKTRKTETSEPIWSF